MWRGDRFRTSTSWTLKMTYSLPVRTFYRAPIEGERSLCLLIRKPETRGLPNKCSKPFSKYTYLSHLRLTSIIKLQLERRLHLLYTGQRPRVSTCPQLTVQALSFWTRALWRTCMMKWYVADVYRAPYVRPKNVYMQKGNDSNWPALSLKYVDPNDAQTTPLRVWNSEKKQQHENCLFGGDLAECRDQSDRRWLEFRRLFGGFLLLSENHNNT